MFDIDAARKSGYSDAEISDYLASEANFDTTAARQAGYSDADIIGHLSEKKPEAESAPLINKERGLSDYANSMGRGLAQYSTAALEGAAGLGDALLSPLYYGARKAGLDIQPMAETVRGAAQGLGVPEPANAAERVLSDASRALGPAAATMGVGGLLSGAFNATARGVGGLLQAAPAQQLASASASGASGSVAEEAGAGPAGQFIAALGGGLAVPGVAGLAKAGAARVSSALPAGKEGTAQAVDAALRRHKIDTSGMTAAAKDALRKETARALRSGDVDGEALRRMADYATVGATPTRGTLTLDPAQITLERNLAKIGMNQGDETLQRLGQVQQQNDAILKSSLNQLGADTADDSVKAGTDIIRALKAADAPRKEAVDAAYKAVRDSSGRYANLNTYEFSKMANQALGENMLGSALPEQSRKLLNDVSTGKIPLNVNTMAQIDKRLSGQARDMFASGNSEGALAIRQIRNALSETPVETTAGADAVKLYENARRMAADRFAAIERTPALKAALDDVAPDKFVQTFVLGSGGKANVRDVASLAENLSANPEAFKQAKVQLIAHLKDKALSGGADETANFSPSAFRRAMKAIGERKLGMFFNKEEMAQIKAVGRVASYEKFQPTGSAVNNSNTAGALAGKALDLAGRLPFGKVAIVDPAQSVIRGRQAQSALAPRLTTGGQKTYAPSASLLLPPVYGSGLLSGE